MIARFRMEHAERGTIELIFDSETKRMSGTLHNVEDEDSDRLEVIIQQLCIDGDLRPILVWLKSHGYTIWKRVEDTDIAYLIREVLQER